MGIEIDRKRSYEKEFFKNDKGKCEKICLPFSTKLLCNNCREIILSLNWNPCYCKAKYIMRSKTSAFRDVRVCGTHKRHLMSLDSKDNYYADDEWYVLDDPEVKLAIKLLINLGYEIKKDD